VIIEEAPKREEPECAADQVSSEGLLPLPLPLPLLISGRDRASLGAQGRRLSDWLKGHPELKLKDVAHSAALHRTHFETRACIYSEEVSEACEALDALAEGRSHRALVECADALPGGLAVLFTGQGSQRLGMGRELYERCDRYRETFDEVCEALAPHLSRGLLETVFAREGSEAASLLDQTAFAQPALFALEVALYRQWQHWGLRPSYLVGHSIGELSAARGSRTCLIVSQRLAAVRDADQIVVLDEGRIIERGTHASLLRQGGRYAAMYRRELQQAETGEATGERENGRI